MSLQRFNLISLHEAIDLLGVSRSTFDRWRKLKQLPYVKIGKEILIDKEELEKWVRHHASGTNNPVIAAGAASIRTPQEQLAIKVGYQSGTAHMWTSLLMKELGWFEEELALAKPGRTVRVDWFDAANGTVLLQGLIGGSIQIASLGDFSIVLSQSLRRMLPSFRPVLLAFDGKALAHYQGIGQMFNQEGMGEDYLTGVVAEENWLHHHQEDTVAYLKAHVRVHAYIRDQPQAVVELIACAKGIPAEIIARILGKVRWDSAFYKKDMKVLELLQQENPESTTTVMAQPFSNEICFKIQYLQEAIKALQLPHHSNDLLEGEWADEQLY
ncbi:helix-turn-helix domain-containing protein [Paenibacillus aceris]|uniref:Excisionase family DNA binding protein n=1 Tax=Paenibacillus aceris TaxID=869555 RepID=A0ABS4HW80_9BACL|nr:helix-turn-helix domain-containing protein [Paenibacillus aceris]MBP1962481.1 excisionase family DNA binding protein [Paenibacillus aceris]NHW37295.1 helix-turn-helix domain-containing protein [Paenibacillus aceris]